MTLALLIVNTRELCRDARLYTWGMLVPKEMQYAIPFRPQACSWVLEHNDIIHTIAGSRGL